jgi:hypothetical protein
LMESSAAMIAVPLEMTCPAFAVCRVICRIDAVMK